MSAVTLLEYHKFDDNAVSLITTRTSVITHPSGFQFIVNQISTFHWYPILSKALNSFRPYQTNFTNKQNLFGNALALLKFALLDPGTRTFKGRWFYRYSRRSEGKAEKNIRFYLRSFHKSAIQEN